MQAGIDKAMPSTSISLRPYRSPMAPRYRTDAASPSEYPTATRFELRLAGVERLTDRGQRDVGDRQVEVGNRCPEDQRGEHQTGTCRGGLAASNRRQWTTSLLPGAGTGACAFASDLQGDEREDRDGQYSGSHESSRVLGQHRPVGHADLGERHDERQSSGREEHQLDAAQSQLQLAAVDEQAQAVRAPTGAGRRRPGVGLGSRRSRSGRAPFPTR